MTQTHDTRQFAIDREGKLHFTRKTVTGESITILGRKGMGKSNTMAVFGEELLEHDFPLVLVDPQDEYYGLAERYNVLRVGRSANTVLRLDPEKAGALAEYSLKERVPVILSLYKYDPDERFMLLRGYFERLWELEEELKQPYMILLEEAHKYLPESGSTPVTAILNDIFLLGRKNGLGTILATQRSAKISKDTITQSGIYVLHKVTHPVDVSVYQGLIPLPAKEADALIRRQRKGRAIVLYDDDTLPEDVANDVLVEVQIRQQHTYHAGATPSFDEQAKPTLRQLDEHHLHELQALLARATPDASVAETKLYRQMKELERHLQEKQTTIDSLTHELGKRDETIAGLMRDRDLLSRLTVSLADVSPLLPTTMQIEQASVEKATVQQLHTPTHHSAIVDARPLEQVTPDAASRTQVSEGTAVSSAVHGRRQATKETQKPETQSLRPKKRSVSLQQAQVASPLREEPGTGNGLQPLEQRYFDRILLHIRTLSLRHRQMILMLSERQSMQLSISAFARRLGCGESTLSHPGSRPQELVEKNYLRAIGKQPVHYQLALDTYLQKEFPHSETKPLIEQVLMAAREGASSSALATRRTF